MKKYRLRRIGVASNEIAPAPSLSDCIELMLGQVDALGGDVIDALKVALGPPGGEPSASSHSAERTPHLRCGSGGFGVVV